MFLIELYFIFTAYTTICMSPVISCQTVFHASPFEFPAVAQCLTIASTHSQLQANEKELADSSVVLEPAAMKHSSIDPPPVLL